MTIHFGQRSVKLFDGGPASKHQVINGYYLVVKNKKNEEHRYWMGCSSHDVRKWLDNEAGVYLGDFNKWQYWIDHCSGYDIDNNLVWANIDQTDRFI